MTLTIETALLLSGVSLAFSVYFGLLNARRSQKADTQKDASEMTKVIVKLENISAGIAEIKSEMSSQKQEIKDIWERLVTVEQSAKQAHRRLDELKGG